MLYKKILFNILIVLMLLSFSGCGSGTDNTETQTEETDESSAETTMLPVTSETEMQTSGPELTALQQFLKNVSEVYGTEQIILSYQEADTVKNKGRVYVFEKTDDNDFKVGLSDIEVVYGKEGLDKTAEGDKKAPSGIFYIPYAFGSADNQNDLKIEYRVATDNDYWVDDVDSEDYNTWQRYEGDPDTKWRSYERLNITSYRIALVIGYNTLRMKGMGSAIFFHVWKNNETFTSGCTATDENSLLSILKLLDPAKRPVIIQGSIEYFNIKFGIDIGKEISNGAF